MLLHTSQYKSKLRPALLLVLVSLVTSTLTACERTTPEDNTSSIAATEQDEKAAVNDNSEDPNSFEGHASIVTSTVSTITEGSPEAVLAKAINTLYYGDAKDAIRYYKTSIPDFSEQLINTQETFQKTVKNITINEIAYNEDKTLVSLKGNIALNGVETTDYAEFDLQKIDGVWLLLTE